MGIIQEQDRKRKEEILQACPALQLSLSPCALHIVIQRLLVLLAEPARHFPLSALLLGLFSLSKEPCAKLISQAEHTAANRRSVASILALATGACNLLGEIPQLSFSQ